MVLKDKFVLDLTANPDFSQVESDEPQVTVNQRFEVFFPEKRPFFLENSNYFLTPYTLVFTRRIEQPKWGVRLTGKDGPWTVGLLAADDAAPGLNVPKSDPNAGKHAYYSIARISHDIGSQSSIGVLYTDREFGGGFNRVGGLDGRFRLGNNWIADFQGVASSTRNLDGSYQAGRCGIQMSSARAESSTTSSITTIARTVLLPRPVLTSNPESGNWTRL